MVAWKLWRWVVMAISTATALVLFGMTSGFGITLNSNIFTGLSISTLLAIANGVSVWALWKYT